MEHGPETEANVGYALPENDDPWSGNEMHRGPLLRRALRPAAGARYRRPRRWTG